MSLDLGCPLQNGDIIEILQTGHRHWAVYVGDGYIVHITGRLVGTGDDSVHGESAVVEKTMLEEGVKGCDYKVNNIYDVIPLARDEVVNSALQTVGENKPYGSSCRDFALELKYGRGNLDVVSAYT
ncbi:phospholipase A and acyltransferase 4-like isoform X2 [Mixophyes fleayi]|uniref:phospholipase A and acyltransferase 4-like isoform X2 n=1 Tax=Mixophyes fleayi TaxID=3061075 RepID=UPI003F4DDC60